MAQWEYMNIKYQKSNIKYKYQKLKINKND